MLSRRSRLILSFVLLASFLPAACSSTSPLRIAEPWRYADLRLLDPIDAPQPGQDIVAVYTRYLQDDLQIRLDLLEHAALPDFDLYLALDFTPGGATSLPLNAQPDIDWDLLLAISASGSLKVLSPGLNNISGTALSIIRDPLQDTLTIALLQKALIKRPKAPTHQNSINLQIFLTPADSPELADSTLPFHTQTSPPDQAAVLFTFWNTYPAYSPALALRRWDGAHTGPFGGRHGLYNLLRTANAADIPLVLLDLKSPASLAALDYAGGLELTSQMQKRGLLLLPEYLPDIPVGDSQTAAWLAQDLLRQNLQTAQDFALQPSQFLSTSPPALIEHPAIRFVFLRALQTQADSLSFQTTTIARWRSQRLLIIPGDRGTQGTRQATPDGLSLELRRALINAALSNQIGTQSSSILLLGGDLPASDWGAPQAARAAFRYIQNHPWIRVLNAHDLLTDSASPAANIDSLLQESPSFPIDDLAEALQKGPDNRLLISAQQALQSLYGPIYPYSGDLPALRQHYTTSIWSLVEAGKWAAAPGPIASCDLDPDHDYQPECILASNQVYAQIEIDSGTLTHLFIYQYQEGQTPDIHQLVAPSSQFSVGLSEPLTWDMQNGLSADPNVLPGAFHEPNTSAYQSTTGAEILSFTTPDGDKRKTFRLLAGGIRIDYQSSQAPLARPIQLPISLDPWSAFTLNWSDQYQSTPLDHGWLWQHVEDILVTVKSSTEPIIFTFSDTKAIFNRPENPNRDYPAGHYLVFPQALFSFPPQESFWLEIIADSPPQVSKGLK
ncbi:hypothetical protein ACFLZW_03915 [Chloroflexota bacterium]